VATKITAYYEDLLRKSANGNGLMKYLNVSTTGLRGQHHPALADMKTTHDVRLSRPHLKFLTGNYLTYQIKANQSGASPLCRLCTSGQEESVSHLVSTCPAMAGERGNILSDYEKICNLTKNKISFCQFILDPTSLNLPVRISLYDPILAQFYRLSRDMCFILDKN
jgi:hypothetical protein